jgi:hypothetical protein
MKFEVIPCFKVDCNIALTKIESLNTPPNLLCLSQGVSSWLFCANKTPTQRAEPLSCYRWESLVETKAMPVSTRQKAHELNAAPSLFNVESSMKRMSMYYGRGEDRM